MLAGAGDAPAAGTEAGGTVTGGTAAGSPAVGSTAVGSTAAGSMAAGDAPAGGAAAGATPPPRFSVVIPAYDEADNIEPLVAELMPVMEALPGGYEVLVIDDGSRDATPERVAAARAQWPAVRLLRMKANRGQSAAFAAGFEAARGEILITLDADLQNNPADIPRLVGKLDEYDVVCGIRRQRRDSWLRRTSSSTARRVRQAVLKDSIQDVGCSIRAFRREHARALPRFNGMHRFIPVFFEWQGLRIAQIDVDHRPRRAGSSKYGVRNRLFATIADLLGVRWLKKRRIDYEVQE